MYDIDGVVVLSCPSERKPPFAWLKSCDISLHCDIQAMSSGFRVPFVRSFRVLVTVVTRREMSQNVLQCQSRGTLIATSAGCGRADFAPVGVVTIGLAGAVRDPCTSDELSLDAWLFVLLRHAWNSEKQCAHALLTEPLGL